MVQNKDIDKEKPTNGETEETLATTKLNGTHTETSEYSEDEDDFLDHLLIVPSLDKNVANRNMNLIAESLSNFYTTIESKKEYPKIKEELMGELLNVPIKHEAEERETKQEEEDADAVSAIVDVNKEPKSVAAAEILPSDEQQQPDSYGIEVIAAENVKLKSFSLCFTKAHFVPEIPAPNMFDQFLICRRCTIFFKTKKFRKMHNALNHRRKKSTTSENIPTTATAAATTHTTPPASSKLTKPRQRIRNGVKGAPLICDLCSKSFKVKALIRSHMTCHTEEKPVQCLLCPYAGKRPCDLRKHCFVHHNPDRIKKKRTRRRKCPKCEEIMEDKQAYKQHMRLNHKEKVKRKPRVFKRCEKCDEPIYTKKGYKTHMKEKHAGFMYIKCERCNRRFKTNFRLKKHVARYAETKTDCRAKVIKNTGEFVCELCSAKFSLKSYLSLHMRKHRVYDCTQCKMSFKSQFSLKYHEFSHLDIEPMCSKCEKVFQSEQKFANHLKRKTCNGVPNGALANGLTTENGTSA